MNPALPEPSEPWTLDAIRWAMFLGLDQYKSVVDVADAFWTVIEAIDALEDALCREEDLRSGITTSGGVAGP